MDMKKIGIIGCGNVGAAIAFELSSHGLFSEMVLIDINKSKAEGEAMDISHGLPFSDPLQIYSGDYADLAGCGIVILAAGANQKPGETRTELLECNRKIINSIVSQLIEYNNECIILVVSNPVDVLTKMVFEASKFPPERVIGSGTVLDTARLKYLLGEHFLVDIRNVHAFIIGEHGDEEFAVWSSANISGIDLDDFNKIRNRSDLKELKNEIQEKVVKSAYKIIDGKGATYYGIAKSVSRIVECIVKDQHSVLPISVLVDGHYGLSGIYMSLPAIVGKTGVEQILDFALSKEEQDHLFNAAIHLKNLQ
jgi:L-lactate dehydrogenase